MRRHPPVVLDGLRSSAETSLAAARWAGSNLQRLLWPWCHSWPRPSQCCHARLTHVECGAVANVAQCSSEAKRRRTLRDTQERAIDSCCRYRAQCAFAAQVSALEHNVSPITAVPAWHGKSGSTNYDDDERLSLLPAGLPDPGSWAGSCLRRSRRWTTSSIDEWCTMRASKARPRTSALHVHVLTRVGLILELTQGGTTRGVPRKIDVFSTACSHNKLHTCVLRSRR